MVRLGEVNQLIIPAPASVLRTMIDLTIDGRLPWAIFVSLTRVLQGFIYGALLGIAIGLMVGWFRIVEDAVDPLVGAIKERLPKVKVGDGLDPSSEMGPLVTREHRDKVASYLESGPAQGATLVADGRETAPDNGGFFLGVSLLDDVTPAMDAYRDEIFGPVLSVVRV